MVSTRATADGTVYLGACKFCGVLVDGDGTNNFDVIVKDGATEIGRSGVTEPARYGGYLLGTGDRDNDYIAVLTSIVVDVTTDGTGGATIYYVPEDSR